MRFPLQGRRARLEPPVDAPPAPPAALRLRAFVLAALLLLVRRGEGHPRLLLALPDLGGHRARRAPSAGPPLPLRQPRAGRREATTARPEAEQLKAGANAKSPPPPTIKSWEQLLWLRGGSRGPRRALVLGKALPLAAAAAPPPSSSSASSSITC